MQKVELIAKIAEKTYSEKLEADKFLNSLTGIIADDLKETSKTVLSGLGTFRVKKRKEKITKHPQKPTRLWKIPARKAVTFTPGTTIKDIVRTPTKPKPPAKPPTKAPSEPPAKTPAKTPTPSEIDKEISKVFKTPETAAKPDILDVQPKTKPTAPTKSIDEAIVEEQKKKASPIPYIDLSDRTIQKHILQKVPEYIAQLYRAVPVEEKGGKLVVAMVDPEDFQAISFIRKAVDSNISIALTTQKDIDHVLNQYSGLQTKVEKVISATELEKEEEQVKKVKPEEIEADTPIARIINSILKNAVAAEASDVHIEPTEENVEIRFRIDGIMQKTLELPKKIQLALVSRVKILSNMKIDEQRLPQDGRFQMDGKRPVDFRVSTFPTVFGEKVVMRLLDKSQGILSLKELGLRGRALEILRSAIQKAHGMSLVCGPTGCGKTTTLYAALDELNKVGVNIVTLEDPVEYQIPGVHQGQVKNDIGFTFASGLRSIVRQDPDVIMVGEIRDLETAELAVQAALTGHIVLSTLHTNDASGAIPRLIDMGVEPFLISSSMNTVVAQRLARKICPGCKQEIKLDPKILEEIRSIISTFPAQEKAQVSKKPLKFYQGKGCARCNNSGYKKRVGIFEILEMSESIRQLAIHKVSSTEITKQARSEGMLTMKEDGVLKCLDGITSIEEAWRVTKE